MQSEEQMSREELIREVRELREIKAKCTLYIRQKVNQLLSVMGTAQLRPEELDDKTLIELDPIGIVSNSFVQILRHLKETNEQVKVAHAEIQAIFDSAGMGILVLDPGLRIMNSNRKTEEQFGIDRGGAVGKKCCELLCGEEQDDCPASAAIETGKPCERDIVLHGRLYHATATPLMNKAGEVTRIVLVYVDLTERMAAQEELRRSEERYRDLFENSSDLIQILNADSTIRYVNRAWRAAIGYSQEDLKNLSIFDLIDPTCDDCGPEFKSVVCGHKQGRFETTFMTRSGSRIIVEGNVSAITEHGTFIGTRGIFRDITERKRSEQLVASEREQLAVTLRSIGDGVITTDIRSNVVLINRVAERLTGWTQADAAGKSILDVFRVVDERTGEPRVCPVERVLETRTVCEMEGAVLVARDGSNRIITDSVAPILDKNNIIVGTVLVFRDITERKRLEERIVKTERIESLGVLAGGIAHDFNNLLNAIIGNIDIGRRFSVPDSEVHKSLMRAAKASEKAKELTQQLLTFSKGGAPVKKLAAISDLIRDTADFGTRGSNVTCEFLLPADLWVAEIDQGQISQVVNNLVINAVQAMPQGGVIRISASNVTLGPGEREGLNEGCYIKIAVQDHGPGIPRVYRGRIFEPYFTTKASGTGLGLATTYSIVKKHDGAMEVESIEGQGTTFFIYLPASRDEVRQSPVPAIRPAEGAVSARVLLMDDDPFVRETAAVLLDLLGYRVDFANHGNQAIEMYRKAQQNGGPYDVVIMDLTIRGGKGGRETIKTLLEIDPAAKAIVSSGYSNDAVMANYRQNGFTGIIVKPYTMDELDDELKRVLGRT